MVAPTVRIIDNNDSMMKFGIGAFVICLGLAIWKPLVNAATMCGLVVPIALAHARSLAHVGTT